MQLISMQIHQIHIWCSMKGEKIMKCSHNRNGICDIIKKTPEEIGIKCTPFTCSHYEWIETVKEEKMGGAWKPEYGRTRRTKTQTSTEVKNRYNRKHYDRMSFVVPAGSRELIKARAEELGVSVNEYIRQLIVADAPQCIIYQNNPGGGGSQ